LNTVILSYSQTKFFRRPNITKNVRISGNNKTKNVKLFNIYNMGRILNKAIKYNNDVVYIIVNNPCTNPCQDIYYNYEEADLEISVVIVPHSGVRVYICLRETRCCRGGENLD
jgi:hypothetical protein